MNPNRKRAEEYLYASLKKVDKSGKNVKIYQDLLSKMSDTEFFKFVDNIADGTDVIALYTTNMVDQMSIEELLEAGDYFGIDFFERLRRYDTCTGLWYTTPYKCCILELPVRRTSQFIEHKISVAEGDSKIDLLSGQVVREDKAAQISQVEAQTMYARNLKKTIVELMKYRGGDVVAQAQYKRELEEQGTTSVEPDGSSVPRSAVTLDVYFSGMQIESNASGL